MSPFDTSRRDAKGNRNFRTMVLSTTLTEAQVHPTRHGDGSAVVLRVVPRESGDWRRTLRKSDNGITQPWMAISFAMVACDKKFTGQRNSLGKMTNLLRTLPIKVVRSDGRRFSLNRKREKIAEWRWASVAAAALKSSLVFL
jgi:hypothetical protein